MTNPPVTDEFVDGGLTNPEPASVTIVCNGTASGSFVESIGDVSVQTDHGRRLLDYLRARERRGST